MLTWRKNSSLNGKYRCDTVWRRLFHTNRRDREKPGAGDISFVFNKVFYVILLLEHWRKVSLFPGGSNYSQPPFFPVSFERLARLAVAGIARVSSFGRVLLVTEMMSHLSIQDPFNQGFGELLEETAADRSVLNRFNKVMSTLKQRRFAAALALAFSRFFLS